MMLKKDFVYEKNSSHNTIPRGTNLSPAEISPLPGIVLRRIILEVTFIN